MERAEINQVLQPAHKDVPLDPENSLSDDEILAAAALWETSRASGTGSAASAVSSCIAKSVQPLYGLQTAYSGKELIEGIPCTVMEPGYFKDPVKPLCVSGGTAAFYRLELANPDLEAKHYWIGKNVHRAKDEIEFYEKCLQAKTGHLASLLRFTFEYAGVIRCHCELDGEMKDILVMRNLRDGAERLRMLDLKIGEKTASSGWKGKSSFAAMRQSMVDQFTNSSGQGFRLEGFDNPPAALKSMDPLLDFGGAKAFGGKVLKRATRVQFQRMRAREIFMHFIDVSEMRLPQPGEDRLFPVEWAELVLFKVVTELVELDKACRKVKTPQKWIGSSVAIAFDCEQAPARSSLQEDGPPEGSVKVNIFDWGRSELNLPQEHAERSPAEQADREIYWKYYTGGICLLAWEAMLKYYHRFSCVAGWMRVTADIYDFDSTSALDYIGSAVLRLRESRETSARLTYSRASTIVQPDQKQPQKVRAAPCPLMPSCCGNIQEGRRIPGRVYYSCEWHEFPQSSSLEGSWRITLHRAEGISYISLTELELRADPVVVITACESMDGETGRVYHQQSSVKLKTANPVWEECFELPVARSEDKLLRAVSPIGITDMEHLRSLIAHPNDAGKEAFKHWRAWDGSRGTYASEVSTNRW